MGKVLRRLIKTYKPANGVLGKWSFQDYQWASKSQGDHLEG